jgi:Ran GTPase-activating protein (RanGAP) involved in mRNA processing and transport
VTTPWLAPRVQILTAMRDVGLPSLRDLDLACLGGETHDLLVLLSRCLASQRMPRLQHLNLSWAGVGKYDDSLLTFTHGLAQCPGLSSLMLGGNEIDYKATRLLCEPLPSMSGLMELHLPCNALGDQVSRCTRRAHQLELDL